MLSMADIVVATAHADFACCDSIGLQKLGCGPVPFDHSVASTGWIDLICSDAAPSAQLQISQSLLAIVYPKVVTITPESATEISQGVDAVWAYPGVVQITFPIDADYDLTGFNETLSELSKYCELCAVVISCSWGPQVQKRGLLRTCVDVLAMIVVPVLAVCSQRVSFVSTTISCVSDWRICTAESQLIIEDQRIDCRANVCCRLVQATELSPESALAHALCFGCSMQQAPQFGLQHTLHLTRASTQEGQLAPADNTYSNRENCKLLLSGALQSRTIQPLISSARTQSIDELAVWFSHQAAALYKQYSPLNNKPISEVLCAQDGEILGSTNPDRRLQPPGFCPQVIPLVLNQERLATNVPHGDVTLLSTSCILLGATDTGLVNLSLQNRGSLAFIELNDPRHFNAEDLPLMDALRVQLSRIASYHQHVESILIRGAGAHFCTGKCC